jgi:transcriptional regulator with XRE-family HTH domain
MVLRIKEVLKSKGHTIQSLADVMGINRVSLTNSINGNPTVETLGKIASALGVEIWELLTESVSNEELIALINHKGDFYQASTIEELERIVDKIKSNTTQLMSNIERRG